MAKEPQVYMVTMEGDVGYVVAGAMLDAFNAAIEALEIEPDEIDSISHVGVVWAIVEGTDDG